jgi:magnesium-transporting ATPase (P-type)
MGPEEPGIGVKPSPPDFHTVTAQEALAAVHSTPAGLSAVEAAKRLERLGENRLPEAPARNPLLRLLAQFNNILIHVLLVAAIITAALGHATDTGVILAVVIANALIGFIQEGRAERAMEGIRQMLASRTAVLRDGRRQSMASVDVAVGDIVLLEAGEKVPADLRLLEASGLRIDEAILTGESVPAGKSTKPVSAGVPLGERSCMAFSGTLVAAGAGRGVVVATGAASQIGQISGMLAKVEKLTTPLVRQMDGFARWLTILILLISAMLLVYGYYVSRFPFAELFMTVVGLAVAAIPEGLPAVLTITLAVGVQAMARRNVIVRRLPAIETLGSVSVICTDKTGTLTRNEMMAVSIATADKVYSVTGDGYAPEGSIILDGEHVAASGHALLTEIARAAALCNDAALHPHQDSWRVEGDPMEGALMALAAKIIGEGHEPFAGTARTDSIPFDASHRYMAVLHHEKGRHGSIYAKGAPERILAMCASQRSARGGTKALDPKYWHRQTDAITRKGQRVLAFAIRRLPHDHVTLKPGDLEGHMVLLGLVGLIDPPRPEAIAAVAQCHDAGIRVKMITGDHAGTASAIGRQIGLRNPDRVLTGADLEKMDEGDLATSVVDTDIFARTSPEHKLRLVKALQSHGLTVAMTGDGVNDAPALKRADAGIAMGRKGSEAAKEAAVLVLADDNFASITAAVREGRTVYDNIKKVISWTLPTNGGEAMTIIVALLFNMALPITAVQILWINLVTDVTLGAALAFEPTEENTMKRPPRPRSQPLLGGQLVWHITLVSVLFMIAVFGVYAHAVDKGYPVELARTMALNTIVTLEIFHLFFVRNIYGTSLTLKAVRGTPVVWASVIAVAAAQFAITYVPALQQIFGTRAVPIADGFIIVATGVLFFAILEAEKQLRLVLARPYAGASR